MNIEFLEKIALHERITPRANKLIFELSHEPNLLIAIEKLDLTNESKQTKNSLNYLYVNYKNILASKPNKEPHQLSIYDEYYPNLLREIPDPPKSIYWKGNIGLLGNMKLSIVGTRKCSEFASRFTLDLIANLAINYVAVSGLAFGVDSLVHKYSVEYDVPTIAVLPNNLENISPRSNLSLAKAILDSDGLLITEFKQEQRNKYSYIARNRIIAALSQTTIIVEAPQKSGSLTTGRFALDYNRNVLVANPLIYDLRYQGGMSLVDNGEAELISDQILYSSDFLQKKEFRNPLKFDNEYKDNFEFDI